jgi:hypothetical protein
MSDFRITINADALAKQLNQKKEDILKQLRQATQSLAAAAHVKVLELAGEKLKTLQIKYKDAVGFEQVDDNLWVITLKEEAMFIEKGHGAWSMYDALAKSKKAKTSKDGNRYLTIPFEHSKRPAEQTIRAKQVTDKIRAFLKTEKIPYKKIEHNPDGSPKLGLIHKFDVMRHPKLLMKHPSDKAKSPLLQGLAIYQRKDEKSGKVKRDVMTFRVVSEKTKNDGRWEYQPREAANIFKETHEWALGLWERELVPALIESLK